MARPSRRIGPWMLLIGSTMLGGTAMAETDFFLKGALSLSGVRDDNLFYTSVSRQSDVITRVSPGVEAGVRSARLSLEGKYSLDAERFSEHPELDTNRARQFAAIDLETKVARPVAFTLHGDYLSTLSPGELNLATGLPGGRARARRQAVRSAVQCDLGTATIGTVAWTLTRDDLAGGIAADSRAASFGLERRVSRRDTLSPVYSVTRYGFEGEAPFTAHILSLGWDRRVGPRTGLTLRGGPRYAEGRLDPEASLAIHHGAKKTQTSLTLGRTLTTVIGQAGTVVSDSVLAGFSFEPLPSLRIGVTPSAYRINDPLGGQKTRVYATALEATWRLSDRLSLQSTYQRNLQRGGPGSGAAGGPDQEIVRNTFYLGLSAGRTAPAAADRGANRAGDAP